MHHEILFAPASQIPAPAIPKRSRSLQVQQQRRSFTNKPLSSPAASYGPSKNSVGSPNSNSNKKQSEKGAASKKSPKKRNSATHIGTAHSSEPHRDLQEQQQQRPKNIPSAPHGRRRSKSASVYAGAAFNSAAPEPSSLPVPTTFTTITTRKRTISLNTHNLPLSLSLSRSAIVRQSFPVRMSTSHHPNDHVSLTEIKQGIWSLLKINEP